jgi:hypothetical protein
MPDDKLRIVNLTCNPEQPQISVMRITSGLQVAVDSGTPIHMLDANTSRGAPRQEPKTEEKWLTRKLAAKYLNDRGCTISEKTLANWACLVKHGIQRGPQFTKFLRKPMYRPSDLDQFRTECADLSASKRLKKHPASSRA